MNTITVKIPFEAAHRLLGHSGKCKYIHGHSYLAEITVSSPKLNDLGMVVDFGYIKSEIGKWINDNWDHNIVLHEKDPLIDLYREDYERFFAGKKPYLMARNPTAENLANELFDKTREMIPDYIVKVEKVRIWETPNSCAEAVCEK